MGQKDLKKILLNHISSLKETFETSKIKKIVLCWCFLRSDVHQVKLLQRGGIFLLAREHGDDSIMGHCAFLSLV